MNAFKDAGHIFRLAAVFVCGILVFVGVRAVLVPKSFGQYGHYRGDALAEERNCFGKVFAYRSLLRVEYTHDKPYT